MEIEMVRAANGYIVTVSDEHDSMRHVFNDIEAALKFIRGSFGVTDKRSSPN